MCCLLVAQRTPFDGPVPGMCGIWLPNMTLKFLTLMYWARIIRLLICYPVGRAVLHVSSDCISMFQIQSGSQWAFIYWTLIMSYSVIDVILHVLSLSLTIFVGLPMFL